MPITTAGRNIISQFITGASTTYYNTTNARIGVGDNTTAFAVGQTDLQAATNRFRKICTTASTTTNVMTFTSTFTTGEANFSWQEWGIFNDASAGTMLSRRVENLGVKVSGSWTLTVTLTLTAT